MTAATVGPIAAVVVTYHPGEELATLLAALAQQTEKVVIVDNGSPVQSAARVRQLCEQYGCDLIANDANLGVARALNQGVQRARALLNGAWVALFDQDSAPFANQIAELLAIVNEYPDAAHLGVVGSNHVAAGELPSVDAHTDRDCLWRAVDTIITSGSLISMRGYDAVQGFRDAFFIDFVDFDYVLRLRRAGFASVQSCAPLMVHAAGEGMQGRFLGRTFTSTNHRAERRYYMARNLTVLAREQWRAEPRFVRNQVRRYVEGLGRMVVVEKNRPAKIGYTLRGLVDALASRSSDGPLASPKDGSRATPSPAPAQTPGEHVALRNMSDTPLFTIFTAAYNRPRTLRRVYESLMAQSFRDFEWLIVDDGSGPEVRAAVEALQAEVAQSPMPFPIRYFWKENQGKHTAHNRGVIEAHGRYFAMLDDDDVILPNALERMAYFWNAIPEVERDGFAAVMGHCIDQNGAHFGRHFPAHVIDVDYNTMIYKWAYRDELWGSFRTDVLLRYPYPVAEGPNTWMAEPIPWRRIARAYRTRFVDEVWRVWVVGHYSLSSPQARKHIDYRRIAPTQVLTHQHQMVDMIDYFRWHPIFIWMSAAHYTRFSLHAGYGFVRQWRDAQKPLSRLMWLSAYPVGVAGYVRDLFVQRKRSQTTEAPRPYRPADDLDFGETMRWMERQTSADPDSVKEGREE